MKRNFAKPIRFRDEKSAEELNWGNFKRISNRPLKRMSRVVGRSMIDPRKKAGMSLYRRPRF